MSAVLLAILVLAWFVHHFTIRGILADSIQLLYQWMRSTKYFGFRAWMQEVFIGIRYLSAHKRHQLDQTQKLNSHE